MEFFFPCLDLDLIFIFILNVFILEWDDDALYFEEDLLAFVFELLTDKVGDNGLVVYLVIGGVLL